MTESIVDDIGPRLLENESQLASLVAAYSAIENLDVAAEFLSLRARQTGATSLIDLVDYAFLPPFIPSAGYDYLAKIRPRMQDLAMTGAIFEPWTAAGVYEETEINEFLASLNIPQPYHSPLNACMILYHLGELANSARVSGIFSGKNTFLVNGSGTGKTRICYEGLCSHWGFYFTFKMDSGELGSFDIEHLLRRFKSDVVSSREKTAENVEKITHIFGSILMARLTIFLLFLETVQELGLNDDHKKQWLLLQLNPRNLSQYTIDAFSELARMIQVGNTTNESLRRDIRDALRKIQRVLGGNQKLVIVLDEAQQGLEFLSYIFRDKEKVLHIVIKSLQHLTNDQCTIICSGINLPQSEFVDTIGSDFIWTSDTGAFDDPAQQESYVRKLLPPTFRDSPSGQFLVARIWRWLRGRHRFTSAFMGVLLMEGLHYPHNRLNDMLHALLGIKPVDAALYSRAEGVHPQLWQHSLAGFNVNTISDETRGLFFDILLRYMVTRDGAYTFESGQTKFVYDGWARFVDDNLMQIVLDEPLALLKIARHLLPFPETDGLKSYHPATFIRSLRTNVPRTTEGLVHCIVLYLSEVFKPHRPLNKIFSFPSEPPSWTDQPASLVRFHRLDTNEITHSTTAPYDFESFRPLAARTTSLDQTLQWMEHAGQEEPPFCLPTHSPNVDLFCALKLADGSLVWVALKAFATAESIDSDDQLEMAFAKLEHNHIFGDVDETTRSRIDLAIDSLPKFSSDRFLRVDTFDAATLSFAALETKKDQVLQTELFDAMIAGVLAGHTGKSRWESDDGALHTATHRIRQLVPEEAAIHQAVPTATWDGRMSSEEPLVVKPKRVRNNRPTASKSAAKPRTTRKTVRRAKQLDDDDDDGPVAESSKSKRKSTVAKKVPSSRPQSALPAAKKNEGKAGVRSDSPDDEPNGGRSLALKKRKRQSDIDATEVAQPAETDKPPAGNTRSKTRAEAKRTRKG
ncbi:hypothetical protein MIND_00890400 [Mycena indigotica]|uniref:Uncharacterized protein n=1 Tax=Mycena indigotica TaxID=2126181 RepID=A0A8H6SH77_9AGAR|nr:uncharacterized protein MIND_00890400 [Mycena indigotica]KAF7299406.1 hypothetical protein MIND_00890400 [Mycena indigotica]